MKQVVQEVELKWCPDCEKDLPLTDFGVNKARKDGLNLYCKRSARQKTRDFRQDLRDADEGRRNSQSSATTLTTESTKKKRRNRRKLVPFNKRPGFMDLAPIDRVRLALQAKIQIREKIAVAVKLSVDEVDDELAVLIMDTHEVKAKIVGEDRIYSLVASQQPQPRA